MEQAKIESFSGKEFVEALDFRCLLGNSVGADALDDAEADAVITHVPIGVPPSNRGAGHLFNGILAVAKSAVAVQLAADIC